MKKHLIISILLITSLLSCDLGMVDKMNEVEYIKKTDNLDDDESAFTTTLSYEKAVYDYFYTDIFINVTFSEDVFSDTIEIDDFTCTCGFVDDIGDYNSEDFSCIITVRSYRGDGEIYLKSNSVMNKEYKWNYFKSNKIKISSNIMY